MSWARRIVHVDMDAFYAAIEERDQPDLRGKAVIIGADPRKGSGRGVVSTANYEARKFGVHSAMPISRAYRLCPHGIYLPPRIDAYADVSREIMDVFASFSPRVEPLSLDEAFLDCTGTEDIFGDASSLGRAIKEKVKERTRLTASVGIAASKYVAKTASDLQKPDGLVICTPGEEARFLEPLPIERMWGIGKKTAVKVRAMGIRTIGDLARRNPEELSRVFGKRAAGIRDLALGIDHREVIAGRVRKSLSEERTFAKDLTDPEAMTAALIRLCHDVGERMRKEGMRGRTVVMKIRYSDFETHTRQTSLDSATSSTAEIREAILDLLQAFGAMDRPVRLLGVGMSALESDEVVGQPELQFQRPAGKTARQTRAEATVDSLRAKFGHHVHWGGQK